MARAQQPALMTEAQYKELLQKRDDLAKLLREAVQESVVTRGQGVQDVDDQVRLFEPVAQIRSRLVLIEAQVTRAKIIVAQQLPFDSSAGMELCRTGRVHINGKERIFTLVDSAVIKPSEGHISLESPLGRALLGMKPGEERMVHAPRISQVKLLEIVS